MGDADATAPKYRPPSPRLTLPLTADQLPENPGFNRIVLRGPVPAQEDWAVLAAYMRRYPHLGLYVDSDVRDLEFLRHFPWLRTFSFLAPDVESVDGLLHVAGSLRILELSPTKRRLSLTVLKRLPQVDRLGVDGPWQGLDVLGDLPSLRSLTLSSIKVDSLDFLRGATGLVMLFLRLGKVDDISDLTALPHLQELTVYRTRIGDLAPISDCVRLAYLQLESVPAPTLPDLSKLTHLKVLWLANLAGMDDLTPVAAAPDLRYLLVQSSTLDPQALAVLRSHPTLEYLTAALGSKKRIAQAYEAAPYPRDDDDKYQFGFRRELAKQIFADPEAEA